MLLLIQENGRLMALLREFLAFIQLKKNYFIVELLHKSSKSCLDLV
jgi:hypothetical protein